MNELKIFDNPEFGKIKTLEISGNVWFVGKDVAEILGYTNPQKAIRDHVDIEDKEVNDSFTVNGTKAIINQNQFCRVDMHLHSRNLLLLN